MRKITDSKKGAIEGIVGKQIMSGFVGRLIVLLVAFVANGLAVLSQWANAQ